MIVPQCSETGDDATCPDGLAPGKRERNRLERRAAIVAVARALFLEQGYAATTMSAVAEAMGGSKATLWAHFSSKEALFAEVADVMVGGFAARLDELLGGQRFSIAGLRDFCLRFVEKMQEPESTTLFRMIMAEGGRFPELGEMFYARGPQLVIGRLARYFEDAFAQPEAERLAQVTISALVGFRTQGLILPARAAPGELRAFVDHLVATLPLDRGA